MKNNTPTYKEQFDKLTVAYIADKVIPLDCCACFVGNLLNGQKDWSEIRLGWEYDIYGENSESYKYGMDCIITESNGLYTAIEISNLEQLFMETWRRNGRDEDALFIAFEKTLDLLKQIHISKGEVIDETPLFKKRVLSTC